MLESTAEYWFVFHGHRIVLTKNNYQPPTSACLEGLRPYFIRQHALILPDNINYYCAEIDIEVDLMDELLLVPLRQALDLMSQEWHAAAAKAFSIINWDRNHQFCGRCGNATRFNPPACERVCAVCKLLFYPRLSPSVIVLIKKEDHILMARGTHFPAGVYGLIAGFVEAGENLEQAVHREVLEEVNLQIKNLQYFGSQFWPFPDSLMMAFTADYAAGELIMNKSEIESAGWYRFDKLPGRPASHLSIAQELIDYFVAKYTRGGC